MSCPSWQWHRTGSRWSPVCLQNWKPLVSRTLPVAPLWCDLEFVPNSRGNKGAANLCPIKKRIWKLHALKFFYSHKFTMFLNLKIMTIMNLRMCFWMCSWNVIEYLSRYWEQVLRRLDEFPPQNIYLIWKLWSVSKVNKMANPLKAGDEIHVPEDVIPVLICIVHTYIPTTTISATWGADASRYYATMRRYYARMR